MAGQALNQISLFGKGGNKMNGLMGRTKARLFFFGSVLLLFPVYVLLCPSEVSATLLTYTDTTYAPSYGGTNPITYTLSFEFDGLENDYNATFTVETTSDVSSDEWRFGWVAFKFGPDGDSFTLSSFSSVGTIDDWDVGGLPDTVPDEFVGFSSTDLSQSGSHGGEWLTEGPVIYSFAFEFAGTGLVFEDSLPFKVGFYDGMAGKSGKAVVNQLSKSLAVPEPATMVLLGLGLVGIAAFSRKKFFKK